MLRGGKKMKVEEWATDETSKTGAIKIDYIYSENESTSAWMKEWMNGWMNGWMDKEINEQPNE